MLGKFVPNEFVKLSNATPAVSLTRVILIISLPNISNHETREDSKYSKELIKPLAVTCSPNNSKNSLTNSKRDVSTCKSPPI